MSADSGPWIDLHSHAGRCFLAGLPAGHPMVASLGVASVDGAVRDARAAGVTALVLLGCEGGDFLDGNYRPVLTSYAQLADLTGLLRDRGLAAERIRQVLGGNAAELFHRTIP